MAPLQAQSRPLWRLADADVVLRLSLDALNDEDLTVALHFLVGEDVAGPVDAPVPLFLRNDWKLVVDAMPTFDGVGLVPVDDPEGQAASATVNLSSGESSGEEEADDDEDEERDLEATFEGTGETSPWRRSSALRSMPDDDEANTRQGGEDLPLILKKDRSGLISRGSTLALVPPGASSSPPGAPFFVVGPPEAEPRKRLSGFKLGRSPWDPAPADQ